MSTHEKKDEKDDSAALAAVDESMATSADTVAPHVDCVYSVYEGWRGGLFIAVATVIRRGKTLLIDYDADHARAFGYRTRVNADAYASTPDGAVDRYRAYLQQKIAQAEVTITRSKTLLAMAPKPPFGNGNPASHGTSGPLRSEAP